MTENINPQEFDFAPELRESVKKNIRERGLEEAVVDANVNAFLNEQGSRETVCALNGLLDYLFASFPQLNPEALNEHIKYQIEQEDARLKKVLDDFVKNQGK